MKKYKILSFGLLPVFIVACLTGAYRLFPGDILLLLWSRLTGQASSLPQEAYIVFFQVRLPRIFTAMLVGSSLSLAGATFQAMFRNPLVDSYVLGLSSAAAFGAALSLTILPVPIHVSAFLFGLLAVSAAYYAAKGQGEVPAVSLVLAGVMMSAIFTALLRYRSTYGGSVKDTKYRVLDDGKHAYCFMVKDPCIYTPGASETPGLKWFEMVRTASALIGH